MSDIIFTGTDAFGADVGRHLRQLGLGIRDVPAAEALREIEARPPRLMILAAGYPSPALTEAIDARVADAGTAWLPITFEASFIRVGPWVDHRIGPCFRCYRARRRQHEDRPDLTEALQAAFDSGTIGAPRGHLPHHVRIAAGVAVDLVDRVADQPDVAGAVFAIKLPGGSIRRHHVVGVHRCSRCGRRGDVDGATWLTDLATPREAVSHA